MRDNADDVVSGTYGTPLMVNVGQTTDLYTEVPPGTYYWRVQAVDSGFMASPWSTAGSCRYCPGDLDDDGDVDLADLAALLGNYGATIP